MAHGGADHGHDRFGHGAREGLFLVGWRARRIRMLS